MSSELIAHKDALSFTPIVNPIEDAAAYSAQVITHHRAPDVYEMVFGTTTPPEMRPPRRHLRVIQ